MIHLVHTHDTGRQLRGLRVSHQHYNILYVICDALTLRHNVASVIEPHCNCNCAGVVQADRADIVDSVLVDDL